MLCQRLAITTIVTLLQSLPKLPNPPTFSKNTKNDINVYVKNTSIEAYVGSFLN